MRGGETKTDVERQTDRDRQIDRRKVDKETGERGG